MDYVKYSAYGALVVGGGLTALGFGPVGIVAGSAAAASQAATGNVVAGSAFSIA